MRLGAAHKLFHAERTEDLEPLCEKLDAHGLSAVWAPYGICEMSDDECVAFGEQAILGGVGHAEIIVRRIKTRDLGFHAIPVGVVVLVGDDGAREAAYARADRGAFANGQGGGGGDSANSGADGGSRRAESADVALRSLAASRERQDKSNDQGQ